MENSFKEEDKQMLIDYLNMVATKGKFEFTVQDSIKFFKLLSHMQKVLIPKIDSHILEVKRVIEPENKEEKQKSRAKSSK